MSNKKRYIPKEIAKALGLKENKTDKYRIPDDVWERVKEVKNNVGLVKANAVTQVLVQNIPYYWDKSKEISAFVKNPLYKTQEETETENIFQTFLSNFKKIIETIEPLELKEVIYNTHFDKIVFSDAHVGMNPNPDGYSLYGGKWDEIELFKCFTEMYNLSVMNQKSNVLYIEKMISHTGLS